MTANDVELVGVAPKTAGIICSPARALCREYSHLADNILNDAHTAALMREHGLKRNYTRNANFYRFKFLEVIDPLEKSGK